MAALQICGECCPLVAGSQWLEVQPNPDHRTLEVRRRYAEGREVNLSYRVEEREGATYLVREAALSGAREDLLRNDSARGRLAGTLAVDLLAWSRLLG